MNGSIKFELKLQSSDNAKCHFLFWEDVMKDAPFKIEPVIAHIPPYQRHKFTVTLFRTNVASEEKAMLTGSVKFLSSSSEDEDDEDDRAPAIRPVSSNKPALTNQSISFNLSLYVHGELTFPRFLWTSICLL